MGRSVIDLGARRREYDPCGFGDGPAHTCFLPAPWDRDCRGCQWDRQRIADAQEGSPFTRPMREPRPGLELGTTLPPTPRRMDGGHLYRQQMLDLDWLRGDLR